MNKLFFFIYPCFGLITPLIRERPLYPSAGLVITASWTSANCLPPTPLHKTSNVGSWGKVQNNLFLFFSFFFFGGGD